MTAVKKTETFAEGIKRACKKKGYDRLRKAFFEKKQNLDSVHGKYIKKSGQQPIKESLSRNHHSPGFKRLNCHPLSNMDR